MAPQDFSTAGRAAEIYFRAGGIDLLLYFFLSILIFIGLFENPVPTLETSATGSIVFKYYVQEETWHRVKTQKKQLKKQEKSKHAFSVAPRFFWKAPPKIQA